MKKYDFRTLIDKNLTGGVFAKGGLFERTGAINISYGMYRAEIGYFFLDENIKKRSSKNSYLRFSILINQDGSSFVVHNVRDLTEAVNVISKVMVEFMLEMKKYEFTPCAYELWPDKPDTPYYITDPKRSLCSKVILLDDSSIEIKDGDTT